jgi:hypothetical protein
VKNKNVNPSSIPRAESLGAPKVNPTAATQFLKPVSIPSVESFGIPAITVLPLSLVIEAVDNASESLMSDSTKEFLKAFFKEAGKDAYLKFKDIDFDVLSVRLSEITNDVLEIITWVFQQYK